MDSAATKTFDASSMAGRWDCTALYYTVLYCTAGGTATTTARLTREVIRIFSCLCLLGQSMFNVRFEEAVLPKLLKKWRLL